MADIFAPLGRLREPEYTGDNRCMACTVVNTILATVLGILGWALVAPVVGGTLFVLSVLSIYLRGYLVPGTPELTKRYLPDSILRYFDSHEVDAPVQTDSDIDIEATLLEAGVVDECREGTDLCLTDDFRWEWYERMDQVKHEDVSRGTLAEVLDIEGDIEFQSFGDAYVMLVNGQRIGTWESQAAFYADVAGAKILPDWFDEWEALSPTARSGLLASLRLFLDTCPDCGGDVRLGEETVESCCRSYEVFAVTCTACDSRLFEIQQPDELATA